MRNKFFYIIFLLVLCCTYSLAQNTVINDLNKTLIAEKNDSAKTIILIELASNYTGFDTIKYKASMEQALEILKKNKWHFNWGYYYQTKSEQILFGGDVTPSLIFEDSALYFYNQVPKDENGKTNESLSFQIASVISDKGTTYSTLGRNDEALKYYLESLQLFEKSSLPERITGIAN